MHQKTLSQFVRANLVAWLGLAPLACQSSPMGGTSDETGTTASQGDTTGATALPTTGDPTAPTSTTDTTAADATTADTTVNDVSSTAATDTTGPTQLCGDGVVDDGEQCDDGNSVDGDACTNACGHAACGDGVVEVGVEACDDGNSDEDDACTNTCALPTCMDRLKNGGETDIDCGGGCPADCVDGQVCDQADDCASALCLLHQCVSAAYIKASNTHPEANFGYGGLALSADGKTLAVGAYFEDGGSPGINGDSSDLSVPQAGAVYVYVHDGQGWSQQAYIKAPSPALYDRFGIWLAMSEDGNTLAVGAPGEDSGATGVDGDFTDKSALSAGAAFVFTRNGQTWSQQAYIKASNTEEMDEFGYGIALSADGDTLAVGSGDASKASGIDGDQADNSLPGAGAVHVFARVGQTWSQQAYIKASNPDAADGFGFPLALSGDGDTLAVGAGGEDSKATGIDGDQGDDSALNAGAVYMFARDGQAWSQSAYIKASNTDAGDYFYLLALSTDGPTLAVGAAAVASARKGGAGDQADDSAPRAGAVYMFTHDGQAWSQQAYLKASNTDLDDGFALVALSADGNTLVVGAGHEDSKATGIDGDQADDSVSNAGAAYVFTRDLQTWSQVNYIKATNPDPEDLFTYVALSGDGGTLAVGATEESSKATGINGDQTDNSAHSSGAVYVYSAN